MHQLLCASYLEFVTDLLDQAQSSILISSYSLTSPLRSRSPSLQHLYNILIRRKKEGLDVRVIGDGGTSSRPLRTGNTTAMHDMVFSGIPCRLSHVNGRHHAKFFIIDNESVVMGSHNLSDNALNLNFETSVFFTDIEFATQLSFLFNARWYGSCA